MTSRMTCCYLGTTRSSDTVYRGKKNTKFNFRDCARPRAIIVTGFFWTQKKLRTPFPFWTGNCPLSLTPQLCRPITAWHVIRSDKPVADVSWAKPRIIYELTNKNSYRKPLCFAAHEWRLLYERMREISINIVWYSSKSRNEIIVCIARGWSWTTNFNI